ncbi:MAG TPA: outer membrane protein transport protein [Pirellulales bacterium]|nr:outer membrane protein transport protein [Pirellulales bacterium]
MSVERRAVTAIIVCKTFSFSAALICAALLCAPAKADGLIRDGLGAISGGRGGTNIGFADNGSVIYDNPGALVNVGDNGLVDLGVDTVISQVHYTDNKPNDVQSSIRPMPVPNLAFIKRSRDRQWAWGVGAFGPAGFGADYAFQNSFAGPQTYKSLDAMGKLLGSLSYRVTDRLSIGGSLGIGINYLDLQGPLYLQSGMLAGAPTIVNLQNTGVAPTGSFGIQYLLNEKTTIGLTYISETKFKMGGSMDAFAFGLAPFPIYTKFAATTDLVWPRSLGVGLSRRINRRNTLGVDVIWYDWSHAFNQVAVNLTNPSNPLIAAAIGQSNVQNLPLNWRDTVSLRLGYQFTPDDINIFRFGYVYHASPAATGTMSPYTDGLLTDTFTTGYSRKVGRAYLNAAYQFTFGPTRTVATSALAGGDFSNSTLHAQAHIVMLGLLVPF